MPFLFWSWWNLKYRCPWSSRVYWYNFMCNRMNHRLVIGHLNVAFAHQTFSPIISRTWRDFLWKLKCKFFVELEILRLCSFYKNVWTADLLRNFTVFLLEEKAKPSYIGFFWNFQWRSCLNYYEIFFCTIPRTGD